MMRWARAISASNVSLGNWRRHSFMACASIATIELMCGFWAARALGRLFKLSYLEAQRPLQFHLNVIGDQLLLLP